MSTKKVLSIIFSLLFACAFVFVIVWCIINFNKVEEGISGTGIYTQEDINNAYNDGYNTALENKAEYEELINSYRDTITTQTDQISQLNSQITVLTNNNKDKQTQIDNLQNVRDELQEQVNSLEETNTTNSAIITENEKTISSLQTQIQKLQNSNEDYTDEIEQLNTTITSLRNLNTQLQLTNENNATLISSLNTQIVSLNNQVNDLLGQVGDNSSVVSALNSKIAELEKSIAYYEQYIASLESGEQVVATFEFNGSVYSIQILSKGAYASVTTPTSTDYVIFNYWTVNNEQVDLSTYPVNTNTKFVANVTKKYDVKFIVDNAEYDSQVVTENGFATLPSAPSKAGYEFDGWAINGNIVVDVDSKEVTQNVTYTAVFTKLHTVTFMRDGVIKSTQTIRNGNCATNVEISSTTYVVFNGWTLNGVIVDVTTQPIYADTTFIADITKYYDVIFMVDDEEYDHQIVVENGYAEVPEIPVDGGNIFKYWSINGVDEIDVNNYEIIENTTFISVFLSRTWEVMTWNGLNEFDGSNVWNIGDSYYYSNGSDQYVLDKNTKTWNIMTWNGFNEFKGYNIWTDGQQYYYSSGIYQYVLDTETNTWNEMIWNGDLSKPEGRYIWTDGENYYYSGRRDYCFKLDIDSHTWTSISFSGLNNNNDLNQFNGLSIWSDGINTYYSISKWTKIFDSNTLTWTEIEFQFPIDENTTFNGRDIWSNGYEIYYSSYSEFLGSYQYVLNIETQTWSEVTWSGDFVDLDADYIWTDGENYYYSNGSAQYVITF